MQPFTDAPLQRIAVVGAGFMGCVIAAIYARYGYAVTLSDSNPSALLTFRERTLPIAHGMATSGVTAQDIVDRVKIAATLSEGISGAQLVHEVVQEDLVVKQVLFAELDRLCAPDVVLATNTSSYLLSHLCRDVVHKGRVIGIHYITPAHVVRVVELVVADFTPSALIDWARSFLLAIDRTAVVCREKPGFIVNRIQLAMLSEIHRMVGEGLATPADIDAAVRLSLGPRWALWGALACEDLMASKRTGLAILEYMHAQTGQEHFRPSEALRTLVEDGRIGAAAGAGWHSWDSPYADVVMDRDRQLSDLLAWLSERSGASLNVLTR